LQNGDADWGTLEEKQNESDEAGICQKDVRFDLNIV
jgi:hypothetical protein